MESNLQNIRFSVRVEIRLCILTEIDGKNYFRPTIGDFENKKKLVKYFNFFLMFFNYFNGKLTFLRYYLIKNSPDFDKIALKINPEKMYWLKTFQFFRFKKNLV